MRKTAAGKPALTVLSRALLSALVCLPLMAHAQGLRVPGAGDAAGASPSSPGGGGYGGGLSSPAGNGTSGLFGSGSSGSSVPDDADADRPADGTQPLDGIVAVVNQGVITESELQAQMHLIEGRMAATPGAPTPAPDELRRQVLEQMILQLAQEQYADDYGLKPSAAEVDRAVADVAQNNGLSTQQLEERLRGEGVTFDAFRRQLVAEIVAARLRERETASNVTISEGEIDAELAKSGKVAQPEYDVRQILVKLPENVDAKTVERQQKRAADLVARARKGEDFATLAQNSSDAGDAAGGGEIGWRKAEQLPGLFADALRTMKPGDVTDPIRSPAGFHILKLQDKRADAAASTVELIHARHILLPVSSPESEAEAERRLSLFKRDVEAGKADFATLAKDFSSDSSASKGGDLGWLYPGETVPEFEQALQGLHDGEISEPVRTQFGVHLVQVLGRRTDTESPERLRNAARHKLREAKGGDAYNQWLRELRDRTYVEYRHKSDAAARNDAAARGETAVRSGS